MENPCRYPEFPAGDESRSLAAGRLANDDQEFATIDREVARSDRDHGTKSFVSSRRARETTIVC